ncbi:MAG: hypothetical protein HC819_00485 [Cyclobacteriaceae bacterium]|nr:hypothetical protein [Cyclobacteriaceae bacterium]
MKSLTICFILVFSLSFSPAHTADVHPVYRKVDHIIWVVRDLKSVQKGWMDIGFTEIERLSNPKLTSHGLRDEKVKIRAAMAHLGGARALWVESLAGESIFSRYLDNHGEGALALIHRVRDKAELHEVTQELARANIGKIATYTLQTRTGAMHYTIMDTRDKGKYYLGFVIDERSDIKNGEGQNLQNLHFSQYAFAISDERPVSEFWTSAGFTPLQITHGAITDKEYFGQKADFDMKLGWQRFGAVVYEWIIPLKPPTVYADHIRMHGEGIQHFGFDVADMDTALDFFERKGYKVSMSGGWGERAKPGSGRFAYIDLSKLGGMTIELLWNYKE